MMASCFSSKTFVAASIAFLFNLYPCSTLPRRGTTHRLNASVRAHGRFLAASDISFFTSCSWIYSVCNWSDLFFIIS